MNVYGEIDKLKKLEKEVRQRFKEATERNENEAEALKSQIDELETQAKDYYLMLALGDIERSAYEELVQELKNKKASLSSINKVLSDMERLEKEEIEKEVYKPMFSFKEDFRKTNRDKREALKRELYEAKAEYLQKIHATKEEFESIANYIYYSEKLSVYLGYAQDTYSRYTNDLDELLSHNHHAKAGVNVFAEEVQDTYNSGVLPIRLQEKLKGE